MKRKLGLERAKQLAESPTFQEYMKQVVLSSVASEIVAWLQQKTGRRVVIDYAGEGNFDFEFFQDGLLVTGPEWTTRARKANGTSTS